MKKLIRRSLCQLAILVFATVSVADQPVVFYTISSDDNLLFRMTTNNLEAPVELGEIAAGTDLYGLVDLGEELLTLDRARIRQSPSAKKMQVLSTWSRLTQPFLSPVEGSRWTTMVSYLGCLMAWS